MPTTKFFTGEYYTKMVHTKGRLTLRMNGNSLRYYKAIAESRGIPLNALIAEAMEAYYGEPVAATNGEQR